MMYNSKQIPDHLRKYVVEQNYENYTSEDQAVWRYIMRRLADFLSHNAHPCYLEGLSKSGISTEFIPHIHEMDKKLNEFGWGALPVSGFIPPAAFMEFQSLGILPIACDMRTLDHLLYTPAPDIVHEAAGHAPILIDPAFARYLKRYGEVASQAILTKEDLDQYEAIRQLSDIKENPESTEQDIKKATQQLESANASISHVSEAALLGRMNWWTVEYGLIGDLDNPKIFGAGLLSSVGESSTCLQRKVDKIPLTIHCVDYTYDITEPQPQLFVAPDFSTLEKVLNQLSSRMAFRQGGLIGLEKIHRARSVNTVELNSGLQIAGVLEFYHTDEVAGLKEPTFIKFKGPTQLSLGKSQLPEHGTDHHQSGYSSPIGLLKNEAKCISNMDSQDLQRLGLIIGQQALLTFASGIELNGKVERIIRGQGKIILITFSQCTVQKNNHILYHPDWGTFDLAIGHQITSIFGGPADRQNYNHLDDFVAKRVPPKKISPERSQLLALYQNIRDTRVILQKKTHVKPNLKSLVHAYYSQFSTHWLLGIELLELCIQTHNHLIADELIKHLHQHPTNNKDILSCINEGIRLASQNLAQAQ